MKRSTLFLCNLAFATLLLGSLFADTTYTVNCDNNEHIQSVLSVIQNSGGGRATVDIYGTCKEFLRIRDFDRLALVGHNGATIQNPSGDQFKTIDILSSSFVTLKNLTITGGLAGLECADNSVCHLENNTLIGAKEYGIVVTRSQATLLNNAVVHNGLSGIWVNNGASIRSESDSITENGSAGVLVVGSNLVLQDTAIDFNEGPGVVATNNSIVRLYDATITNNLGNGLQIESASTLQFSLYNSLSRGSLIGGNRGHGVLLLDQANVAFSKLDVVIGSIQQPDVDCKGPFAIAKAVELIGGSTNCPKSNNY